jgi:hypothetical protein
MICPHFLLKDDVSVRDRVEGGGAWKRKRSSIE